MYNTKVGASFGEAHRVPSSLCISSFWLLLAQQWYNKERDEEVVARYTGKTAYGAYGGKRQIAFQKSAYADTEPVALNIQVTLLLLLFFFLFAYDRPGRSDMG